MPVMWRNAIGVYTRGSFRLSSCKRVIYLLAFWVGVETAAVAGEFEDCLISSLKGVSSDVAARMVRQACEAKVNAAREEREAKAAASRLSRQYAKYGAPANEFLSVDTWNRWGSNGPQASI